MQSTYIPALKSYEFLALNRMFVELAILLFLLSNSRPNLNFAIATMPKKADLPLTERFRDFYETFRVFSM